MNLKTLEKKLLLGSRTSALSLLEMIRRVNNHWIGADNSATRVLARMARGERIKHDPWLLCSKRLESSVKAVLIRSSLSPWKKRINNMVLSVGLRAADKVRADAEQWQYSTANWESCAERLWNNANQAILRGRRNPWIKWSMSVAKNINRRIEGVYAKRKTRDSEGERVDEHDRSAGIQMCLFGEDAYA